MKTPRKARLKLLQPLCLLYVGIVHTVAAEKQKIFPAYSSTSSQSHFIWVIRSFQKSLLFGHFRNVLSITKCAFILKLCFHFQNLFSFSKCAFIFKLCFHFQNVLSFSKCAFIFKMCLHSRNMLSFSKFAFILGMCFHFQNVLSFSRFAFIYQNVHNFLSKLWEVQMKPARDSSLDELNYVKTLSSSKKKKKKEDLWQTFPSSCGWPKASFSSLTASHNC